MYSTKLSHEDIKEVINRHDPEGLLALGAPQDEYGGEIQSTYDTICRNDFEVLLAPGHLETAILKIFDHYFGPRDIKPWLPRYHAIAEELVMLLSQKKAQG